MDREAAKQLVASVPHWHHRFEIYEGVETPGSYDPRNLFESLRLPSDLSGLRALDVGPSDGFFSLQMKKRGAEVTAIDYRPKNGHGFPVTEEIAGIAFDYRQMNVYDITHDELGWFDIVLFLGVLYHLPDMMRALDKLRSVCVGRLSVETEHEPDLSPDTAVARYYEGTTLAGDFTNFWAPNRECVMAMLRDSGFEPLRAEAWGRRLLIEAKSVGTGRPQKMSVAYGLFWRSTS